MFSFTVQIKILKKIVMSVIITICQFAYILLCHIVSYILS